MTDPDALVAAVSAAPADDLPRLVFADWLDDHGRADRAAFVRAQCRLAAADPWDPFAVYCRHRRPDWGRGDPWRGTLPRVDGQAVEWHPDRAFRRGFGWSVIVRDLEYFLRIAPRLFAEAPVGELHLPARATSREQWQELASAEWFARVEGVQFYGTSAPIEAVRAISEAATTGLREVVFQSASSPAMPGLLDDFLASPVGKRLKRLGLRVGPTDPDRADELLRSLWVPDGPILERLSLITFPRPWMEGDRIYYAPALAGVVDIEFMYMPWMPLPGLAARADMPRLTRMRAVGCGMENREYIVDPEAMGRVQALDLSENPLGGWPGVQPATPAQLAASPDLRSLCLRHAQLEADLAHFWLTRTVFWPNLVELDLRDNNLSDVGAKHLMAASAPSGLTAVLLDGNRIGPGMAAALRAHFGDALILSDGPPG